MKVLHDHLSDVIHGFENNNAFHFSDPAAVTMHQHFVLVLNAVLCPVKVISIGDND